MYKNIEFLNQFTHRRVGYCLIYAEICDGVKEGLLLSQLMYWWDNMSCTEFYKKRSQLQYECRMSSDYVKRAITKLKALGFITVTRKGLPPTNNFIINEGKIVEQIREHQKKGGTYTNHHQSIGAESTNLLEQNPPIYWRKIHQSMRAKFTNLLEQNPPILYITLDYYIRLLRRLIH